HPPDDAAPLDAAAVATALRFYRSQPALYTAEVVGELRTRLSLDPAGGVDADLAQAVARFQRDEGNNDPELRVDGMAGPRAAPRLFPSGLAAAGEGAQFGDAAQTRGVGQWGTLGAAQARAGALGAPLDPPLPPARPPPP